MAAQRETKIVMIAKDPKENEKAYVERLPKTMLRGLWREQKTLCQS